MPCKLAGPAPIEAYGAFSRNTQDLFNKPLRSISQLLEGDRIATLLHHSFLLPMKKVWYVPEQCYESSVNCGALRQLDAFERFEKDCASLIVKNSFPYLAEEAIWL